MAESWAEKVWAEWAKGDLSFQICNSCGLAQHPPGPVCSHCRSIRLHLDRVSGQATLVAWTTVHRAPVPELKGDVPYTIAIVKLDEGALVEVRAPDAGGIDHWSVGQPVSLVLGQVGDRPMPVVVTGDSR
jgi:uncharacterized OB-fold protein